jgi:WD40 repeat protein
LAYAPDGKTIASGSHDNTIFLWDVATGRPRAHLTAHSGAVRSLAFSHDGKTLVSGSNDYTVKLWDVASGRELATLA